MSLEWKEYPKANFQKAGTVTIDPPNENDFPTVANWSYVLAKCIKKNKDDKFVQEGAFYIIHWWDIDAEDKCEAPNPPFETGESVGFRKGKSKKTKTKG